MSKFGIICEFNPLHNGHQYLIRRAKELGASEVVCVMSGNFTQRGELPITDKYSRAEATIKCDADLVLELPYPWSGASAEYFATAAIRIVSSFCDKLLFGSECGDIELLKKAADVCDNTDFLTEYTKRTSNGDGAAYAFASCLEDHGIVGISSNDILGIAYIRAINRLGVEVEPMTVKRQGADYNCCEIKDNVYQSATAIRRALTLGDEVNAHIPQSMSEIIERESQNGMLVNIENAEKAILGYFRVAEIGAFDEIADAGGGVGNRLIRVSREATTYEQMLEFAKTKRYTDAKLRRAVMFCMTGVKADDVKVLPEYTSLLGANENGRRLLSEARKSEGIRVITKSANAPDCRQKELSFKLDCIFGLATDKPLSIDHFFKKSAYIEK